ncbi:hypothetical protein NM688_g2459 [Phlebia brevispora]|uniref:Uncharacterized protein n=1 Tax=Phlebia brevispora TaxID=194682 RepID=A0ACC1T8A6_9APHY|nr:hypothetical protein NM688_g2459 [Phlebia brevispora]
MCTIAQFIAVIMMHHENSVSTRATTCRKLPVDSDPQDVLEQVTPCEKSATPNAANLQLHHLERSRHQRSPQPGQPGFFLPRHFAPTDTKALHATNGCVGGRVWWPGALCLP